jgi:hypothetical protein
MAGPMVIERGRLLCYRIFDVADEIDLDRAERVLQGATLGTRRVRPARDGSQALSFASPPLGVPLGTRRLQVKALGGEAELEIYARLYDSGAATVIFEVPIAAGTTFSDLLPLCDELYEAPALESVARPEIDALVHRLGGPVTRPHQWRGVETYTVVFVEELRGRPRAAEVLATPGIGKLLLGETASTRLADEERADVLRAAYSYFDDDLAIIDWNSAFVLEPSGSRDIPDILEFATAQLLEMRYYDDLLDAELRGIYDEVEVAGSKWWSLFWSPYAGLARKVLSRLLELTEFTERVENSLKVVGDFYLARVYRGAVKRFDLPSWQASVYRKQSLVAQVYDLLSGEIDTRRNTLLELAIVLLIVLEIALAFIGLM